MVAEATGAGGVKLSFSFTEQEEVQNSVWGLPLWKPLEGNADNVVHVAKLRAVRRSWRF